jgi:dTDP-4-dehydrorhamnose reductase
MTQLKKSRILITGVQGQVGFELVKALGMTGAELILAGRRMQEGRMFRHQTIHLDLLDSAGLRDSILSVKPHLIVNAAAYTAVDKAEAEPEIAYQVNRHAVEVMTEAMRELGGGIIHFSTDYIYNPHHSQPILETENKSPPNVYAASKWAGEEHLAYSQIPHLIFRTSWVYGIHGQNFVKTMLRLGREREDLRIVADQVGSPSSASSLAQAVYSVLILGARDPIRFIDEHQGAYNLTDAGYTNWHEFACEIFRIARELGMELKVKSIEPISSTDYVTPAKRPLNSRLNLEKFRIIFDLHPKSWQTNLQEFMYQASLRL